jgi:rubrerythrin
MVFNYLCKAVTKKCNSLRFWINEHKAVCFCCGTEHYAISEKGRCPYCKGRMKTFLFKEK